MNGSVVSCGSLLKVLLVAAVFSAATRMTDGARVKFSGIPDDRSLATEKKNALILNATLAILRPGDELVFPNSTFHLMGGISAANLRDNVIRIDGKLVFSDNIDAWPRNPSGRVLECLTFNNLTNVTFTATHLGTLDGNGEVWWGYIGYLRYGENRPRLLYINISRNILIEKLFFTQSPYWSVLITQVDGLEIRNSNIINRRNNYDGHDLYNLGAFNTDGFDVTGKNVWIHDCDVWTQDDCITVKDGSENMMFERINASGLGLVIGSIAHSLVRNITFRNSHMHHTFKGIYLKFRGPGLIKDVLYENIVMDAPEQWPIWIGPAQQADSVEVCAAHPCSLCWPDVPFAQCHMPANASYVNITLRNITVLNPVQKSPGVIMGSDTTPMHNVVFENVVVKGNKENYYVCNNVVNGMAIGTTTPVPGCFKKMQ